jgi:hypothetical protein
LDRGQKTVVLRKLDDVHDVVNIELLLESGTLAINGSFAHTKSLVDLFGGTSLRKERENFHLEI